MTLGPHTKPDNAMSFFSLPKNQRLRHRLFQAMLWSRSEPIKGNGVSLSAGFKITTAIQD